MKIAINTSQLTMYGVDSLIDVPYSLAANVAGLVSTASITCSWWGRHAFTGNLASIHKALLGTVLRGPQSAISASTIITAVASSRTCGVAYDNNGDWSWTASTSPSTTTQQTKSRSSTPSLFTSSHGLPKATKTPTIIEESRSLTIRTLRRSPSSKTSPSSTFSERSPDTETPVRSATHLTTSKSTSISSTRKILAIAHFHFHENFPDDCHRTPTFFVAYKTTTAYHSRCKQRNSERNSTPCRCCAYRQSQRSIGRCRTHPLPQPPTCSVCLRRARHQQLPQRRARR
ncbi:Hypothetical protein, putative [Bodo saltans]|uniref:Uncharacterized protein n=1 Tax=Bodo saltans TaxID=75058 RepID=A0A0S4JKB3_BODSA|nr:Hypothetical protein, putative [Bodo saltans]|eukprot:CUG90562.1 Hypothetical protein, putative [Bodo saltans]